MPMTRTALRQRIAEMLKSQYLAVLATSAEQSPYTSLVGYMASQDMREIYFATFTSTRKYSNICKHAQVSLLIDSRTNRGDDFQSSSALTVLGEAETVSGAKRDELASRYLHKFSHLGDFIGDPRCALVRVIVARYLLVESFQEVFELEV